MRHFFWIILIFTSYSGGVKAQNMAVDISYQYLYSGQWDKAIQTYNLSRPYLTEKQPLLQHGIHGSFSYFFDPSRKLSGGLGVGYSFFRSAAENENFANALSLHGLNLGYIFHYQAAETKQGFYADLMIGAVGTGLFRGVNGEWFEFDDTKSKAFGVGLDINLKAGYDLKLGNDFFIHPFLSVGCTPYLYSPDTEKVINQTKGFSSHSWTAIYTAQAGLGFCF